MAASCMMAVSCLLLSATAAPLADLPPLIPMEYFARVRHQATVEPANGTAYYRVSTASNCYIDSEDATVHESSGPSKVQMILNSCDQTAALISESGCTVVPLATVAAAATVLPNLAVAHTLK